MEPNNDLATGDNALSSETIFACFVSGAKFGMIVAVLTILVSLCFKT